MIGMDRVTGKPLEGDAHLVQSIADILSTPIGTRVMPHRDYGSLLPQLVDAPANETTALAIYAATADALSRWEPRLRVTRIAFTRGARAGQFTIELTGERLDQPRRTELSTLTVPVTLNLAAPQPIAALLS